jgi:NAD(P)-dependent dehydrogenase (short-subunit alcohol dehydrogenase family)
LINDIYQRPRRLDGVIHAAGVVDDTMVLNKTAEAFDNVYDTKVVPALTLARVLRPQSLQFVVFFSSVAARFGCSGGADYAAANEVLNKLAWKLNQEWPTRVVAIGWGPWSEIGLATRYSQAMHSERGFDLLPVESGCRYCLDEIRFGRKADAEVVIFVPKGDGPEQAAIRAWAM